jgi:hypothetical protein
MSWLTVQPASERPLFEKNVLDASWLYESLKASAVGGVAGVLYAGSSGWWFGLTRQQIARSMFNKSTLTGQYYDRQKKSFD